MTKLLLLLIGGVAGAVFVAAMNTPTQHPIVAAAPPPKIEAPSAPTLDQQERCSKAGKHFHETWNHDDATAQLSYEVVQDEYRSHFNIKIGRCLVWLDIITPTDPTIGGIPSNFTIPTRIANMPSGRGSATASRR
jgi:hypothetical protein